MRLARRELVRFIALRLGPWTVVVPDIFLNNECHAWAGRAQLIIFVLW